MHHSKNKNLIYLILPLLFIGCQGEEGAIGPVGEDGTDGLTSLTIITTEAPGVNCENGGVKIDVGIDSNTNGTLDIDEIQSTSYICNGVDGQVSLTSVVTEPAGVNCTNGGLRIDSGLDTNSNGSLEASEITATAYVCNGIDGNNSLTKITSEASGTNCENGGLKIDTGVDANSNGTLDDDEISTTAYVCNGLDGSNSLTKITNEDSGLNCENGGLKIDSGVDVNGDGTLGDTEITATAYVCNGIDGNNTLTKITNEAAGTNCENGGLKIDTGIDTNSDGTLDDTEITATAYVCNGVDGNNSLTKITSEAAGSNCENGGLKIDTGVDVDSNGTLDVSEITATAYACNGLDGNISLLNISDESAGTNCANGGVKIESGIDSDSNGTLDTGEIQITRFICNGVDGGFDEQIRLVVYSYSAGSNGNFGNTSGVILGDLVEFSKNNYIGVDSIVFVPNIRTDNPSFTAFADLYDNTNNTVIVGSTVSTTNTVQTFVRSGNIYNALPTDQVDLAIQFRVESASASTLTSGPSYLMLYRSN
ncbi:MAG: hypothetical protein RLN90_09885 [Balneolaceae bacterium]